MVANTCVLCGNRSPQFTLHTFPDPKKYRDIYERWIQVCCDSGRDNFQTSPPEVIRKKHRVCEVHFPRSEYFEVGRERRLKKNSVPVLDLANCDGTSTSHYTPRCKRSLASKTCTPKSYSSCHLLVAKPATAEDGDMKNRRRKLNFNSDVPTKKFPRSEIDEIIELQDLSNGKTQGGNEENYDIHSESTSTSAKETIPIGCTGKDSHVIEEASTASGNCRVIDLSVEDYETYSIFSPTTVE